MMSEARVGIRALFVCDLIAPGGGPTGYTYNLRAALSRVESAGVEVAFAGIVIDRRNRATGERVEHSGVWRTHALSPRRLLGRLRHEVGHTLKGRMSKTLREQIELADLVVFQGFQPARRMRFARRLGKRTAYMPHSPTISADEHAMMNAHAGLRGRIIWSRMFRQERDLIRDADFLVFPTPNSAASYTAAFDKFVDETRVHYLMSGVPRPAASVVQSGGAHPPAVLFVGRYVHHKGYSLFVAAAERLKELHPDLRFATLGAGPDRAESWAVQDLGWHDDPSDVIAQARFLVVPNRVAYFDLLPLEAAALGRGIVFTEVGGNIDQHRYLPDSVICHTDDLETGIARALDLSTDPQWGKRNALAYERNFTAEHMAARWMALLSEWRTLHTAPAVRPWRKHA